MATDNNRELNKVLSEIRGNAKTSRALINTIDKQQVSIKKSGEENVATLEKREGNLKSFMTKESKLLEKSFKFMKARKEGKESGKLRNVFNAKTMGPVLAKGLSLGLMKFGIGGALGAAKAIDVIGSYQEFSKEADEAQLKNSIELMNELRKQGKSEEEIQKTLEEGNLKSRDIGLHMEAYRDDMQEQTKKIIEDGVASGKKDDEIIKALVKQGLATPSNIKKEMKIKAKVIKASPIDTLKKDVGVEGVSDERLAGIVEKLNENKLEIVGVQEYVDLLIDTQKENNKIVLERNELEGKRFEFDKQVEQNEQQRFMQSRGDEKDDEKSSIFGNLFSSLAGLKLMFSGFLTVLSTLATALIPVLAIAGTAFLAFKAGGAINKGINSLTSWFTGKEGETFGGWLSDALSGEGRDKKIAQDEFFATGQGREALKRAKKSGFKVTAESTRGDMEKFLRDSRLKMQEKDTATQIDDAKIQKLKMADESKSKEIEEFKKFKADAIDKITKQIVIDVQTGNMSNTETSKLDNIPSNSDDIQLTYLAKGGAI